MILCGISKLARFQVWFQNVHLMIIILVTIRDAYHEIFSIMGLRLFIIQAPVYVIIILTMSIYTRYAN